MAATRLCCALLLISVVMILSTEKASTKAETLATFLLKEHVYHGKYDVAVILDRSRAVPREVFTKYVDFIKNKLIDLFDVKEGGSHFGLVYYNNNPQVAMKFNENNNAAFITNYLTTRLPGGRGRRNLQRALRYTRRQLLTEAMGDRPDAPNICLLFTTAAGSNVRSNPQFPKIKEDCAEFMLWRLGDYDDPQDVQKRLYPPLSAEEAENVDSLYTNLDTEMGMKAVTEAFATDPKPIQEYILRLLRLSLEDVDSLYTNLDTEMGMKAVTEAFATDPKPIHKYILRLLRLSLEDEDSLYTNLDTEMGMKAVTEAFATDPKPIQEYILRLLRLSLEEKTIDLCKELFTCNSTYYNDLTETCEEKTTHCPLPFMKVGEYCFYLNFTLMTFNEASMDCMRRNGSLVQVDTQEKSNALTEYIISLMINSVEHAYIGLVDVTGNNSDYEWIVDGSSLTFSNWASGEPTRGSRRCVMVVVNTVVGGEWRDVDCGASRGGGMCEIDAIY